MLQDHSSSQDSHGGASPLLAVHSNFTCPYSETDAGRMIPYPPSQNAHAHLEPVTILHNIAKEILQM